MDSGRRDPEPQDLAIPPALPGACRLHVRAVPTTETLKENPMINDVPRTFVGTKTFQVEGMTCDHCRHAVTTEISSVTGVQTVAVDVESGTVTVSADQPVDRSDIAAAVDEAGYTLLP
jgi:copper ion binding protein